MPLQLTGAYRSKHKPIVTSFPSGGATVTRSLCIALGVATPESAIGFLFVLCDLAVVKATKDTAMLTMSMSDNAILRFISFSPLAIAECEFNMVI